MFKTFEKEERYTPPKTLFVMIFYDRAFMNCDFYEGAPGSFL